jgi:hypothetical protein
MAARWSLSLTAAVVVTEPLAEVFPKGARLEERLLQRKAHKKGAVSCTAPFEFSHRT